MRCDLASGLFDSFVKAQMTDVIAYGIGVVLFGVPIVLLGLAIRHFIPLMRGWKAPWWAGLLGPFAYADRFIAETARPHRRKCLAYTISFVTWCLVLVLVFGGAK
jgi:hypothetical protein